MKIQGKRLRTLQSIEICAGAGGQALGLEMAGFDHLALVEIEMAACETLRINRPHWNVIEGDVKGFFAKPYRGVTDLLAGGVPCPPFSVAGKQLGPLDNRDLFPEMIRLAEECDPAAIMIENVRGLLEPKFDSYRNEVLSTLRGLGYLGSWRLLNASDFGVPQLRPRAVLVALKENAFPHFVWPKPSTERTPTVGDAIYEIISSGGWELAENWRKRANKIAPTLVGGSRKHGGPDLGPTRAKKAWAELGVDAMSVANKPPENGFTGMPRLTVEMAAVIQGFPRDWQFYGSKTAAYRQVGNAFPPPVAAAVGKAIATALRKRGMNDHEKSRVQRHLAFVSH